MMESGTKVVFIFMIGFIYAITNWFMDISANFGNALCNGFFCLRNLDAVFHVSWYSSMLLFVFVSVWLLKEVVRKV